MTRYGRPCRSTALTAPYTAPCDIAMKMLPAFGAEVIGVCMFTGSWQRAKQSDRQVSMGLLSIEICADGRCSSMSNKKFVEEDINGTIADFKQAMADVSKLRGFISRDMANDDVFGDATVVIKAAPGHTPGHQVLVLRLASTGRVMLGGDLYHYPPERTLHRAPPDNEFNVQQSSASRAVIEAYLTKTKTPIWIQHDFKTIANLKPSPAYYD